ncbi:transcription elongation factor TFIIS [Quillaja saponaria]|uniref:Transcription elongation factor TFIIS n=1 Tax=Quillaja saponaria TaxID=32244 RepID=A0AAD7PLV0_QUISA|nr:transcription elongation factor TFIIS [Quillaja saponaria]
MEKELVELYEAAKKAADAASSADGEAEESRCLDALELLKQFPVNYQNLVSTQVGKHLKLLTKHPRKKIRALATDLIEIWKRVIIKETSKNKNGNSENHVGSTNVDTVEAEKVQRTPSIKLEKVSKLETIKVEKIEANGISRSDKARKVEVDVIKINSVKKTSSSPAAPPKLTSMIESKDAMRDKIRELLREALSRVYKEAEGENVEEVNVCDPIRVAVTVESVLFEEWGPSNGAQKVKYRILDV